MKIFLRPPDLHLLQSSFMIILKVGLLSLNRGARMEVHGFMDKNINVVFILQDGV